MNLKKYITKGIVAACLATALVVPGYANVAAAEEASMAQTLTEAAETPVLTYLYTSARYGYSIGCPYKPLGVLPVSMFNPGDKGDVLIFEGTVENMKKAWVICINGYDDKVIPPDIGTYSDAKAKEFTGEFAQNYGMSYAQIVNIPTEDGGHKYGVYGATAKNVEIDTDGDGVMDAVAEADTQMMKMFMPGQYGGHFVLGLMQKPGFTTAGKNEFEAAITTFQQWPTSGYEKAKAEAAANKAKKQ